MVMPSHGHESCASPLLNSWFRRTAAAIKASRLQLKVIVERTLGFCYEPLTPLIDALHLIGEGFPVSAT